MQIVYVTAVYKIDTGNATPMQVQNTANKGRSGIANIAHIHGAVSGEPLYMGYCRHTP